MQPIKLAHHLSDRFKTLRSPAFWNSLRYLKWLYRNGATCCRKDCVTGSPANAFQITLFLLHWTVGCTHIRLRCGNLIHVILDVQVLFKHVTGKYFRNVWQPCIEAHSIYLKPSKHLVLWKIHARFRHCKGLCPRVYHKPPFFAELSPEVPHQGNTILHRPQGTILYSILWPQNYNTLKSHHLVPCIMTFDFHACVVWISPCPW